MALTWSELERDIDDLAQTWRAARPERQARTRILRAVTPAAHGDP